MGMVGAACTEVLLWSEFVNEKGKNGRGSWVYACQFEKTYSTRGF
jgi:hypothetical protein